MDPNIPDRSPFFRYKDSLTQYYEATKNFFKNLLEGLEEDGQP